MEKLMKRSDKLSFLGVKSGESEVFYKMTGFTSQSKSFNPKEYTRQYVDEDFERSDTTGFSPSISYTLDRYVGNIVHDEIAAIHDNEVTGADAIRTIITIDKAQPVTGGKYKAVKRAYTIIPDTEGDGVDAYTLAGNFKTAGEKVIGEAALSADGLTVTFTEAV